MNTNGDFSDPTEQEQLRGDEQTRSYEIEPRAEHDAAEPQQVPPTEIVEVHIPSGQPNLPVPRPLGIVVRKRRLALLYLMIALLLVVIGGMAYALIANRSTTVAAASSTGSPSASSQASATETATDATDGPSPGGSASGGPGASGSATAGPSDGGTASSADALGPAAQGTGFTPPFGTEFLPAPVDGDANVDPGQDVHISDVDYANSVTLYCPTNGLIDWNVAGYHTFSAEFGVPDNAQSATGVTNTVTFTDQNGKALGSATTSIGQPKKLTFSVTGVDRLIMSCARQGANNSANNQVTLGNALLSTS